MYCIWDQLDCICHCVHQEPHKRVLHLPSSALHILSCTSRASLGCTASGINCTAVFNMYFSRLGCTEFGIKCTAEAHILQEPHRVYCICHKVYYRVHHVLQEPHWVYCICQKVYSAYVIMYIRSQTWVYCICQQVYCIYHHVHQEPDFGVLHLYQEPHFGLFGINCIAIANMYLRSLTKVCCICHQVYCISYHVLLEPHLGVLHLILIVLQYPTCTSGGLSVLHLASSVLQRRTCTTHWVYCICHHVFQEPHLGVLHLPASVLHMPSCTSGASLGPVIPIYCYCNSVILTLSVQSFITSLAKVMFSVVLVCLSICKQYYSKSYEQIEMKFYGGVGGGAMKN